MRSGSYNNNNNKINNAISVVDAVKSKHIQNAE